MPAGDPASVAALDADAILAEAEQSVLDWETADGLAREHDAAERLSSCFAALNLAGRNGKLPAAWYQTLAGGDFTDGAGPDATCVCDERITFYDGTWLHIINPQLRGTGDHDARP